MVTDLTTEHPDKILWRFLLPMMVSVIFQQLYNLADSMIAGKFAGEAALAAVGASYPVTVIFMAFAVGSNLGTSVIVSRLFGAKDYGRMRTAVTTAFIACVGMSLLLTAYGLAFCTPMMRWIHTPEDILADGALYLRIYVMGLTFLLFYNVCTGIFTALGDSKTPLYFLIGSSIGNIVLDCLFVAVFHMGVAGVAWATFIAQGISAVLALSTLTVRLRRFHQGSRPRLFDASLLWRIAAIAVPSIMQQSVLSVGNLFVQEIVNLRQPDVATPDTGDRQPLRVCGDRRLLRGRQAEHLCHQLFHGPGGLPVQLYGPESGSRKAGTASHGVSHRRPLIPHRHRAVFCAVLFLQPRYDGAVSQRGQQGGDSCRG